MRSRSGSRSRHCASSHCQPGEYKSPPLVSPQFLQPGRLKCNLITLATCPFTNRSL